MNVLFACAFAQGIHGPIEARDGETVRLAANQDVVWWRRQVPPGPYDNIEHCGAPIPRCAQPLPVRWERLAVADVLHLEVRAGAWHLTTTPGEGPPPDDAPVHSLAVRRDETYVGYLHELLGVPFVFAPAHTERGHQTDLREAVDCVSLVIYGQRRLGREVAYVSPHALAEQLEPVDHLPPAPGQVLHWGWQTAVLLEDRPPLGRLDGADLVILAWKGHAEVRALNSLPFAATPFQRMRWPEH